MCSEVMANFNAGSFEPEIVYRSLKRAWLARVQSAAIEFQKCGLRVAKASPSVSSDIKAMSRKDGNATQTRLHHATCVHTVIRSAIDPICPDFATHPPMSHDQG